MSEWTYDWNTFQDIMDQLVVLNRELRNSYESLNPRVQWYGAQSAAEFCTITCNIGRRSGKSEWIRRVATEDDLIVAVNQDMAERCFPKAVTKATVLTARTLGKAKGRRFQNVYVDEPLFVFRAVKMHEFYTLLAVDQGQTFFFLGGFYE